MKLKKFFSKWFYISIILILFSFIVIDISTFFQITQVKYLIKLTAKLLESIGIAIFVANIFTFILGTNEFMNYIRKKLMKIVISKDFITQLKEDEQKKLLHLTLKPTKKLSEIYSGINEYFNSYINKSINLFTKSYRGNLIMKVEFSFNETKKCIQSEIEMDYDIYKVTDKFEALEFYFEDESFVHEYTKVFGKDKEFIVNGKEGLEKINEDEYTDSMMKDGYNLEIPEEFNKCKQISINRKFIEYGNDHWQVFSYKTTKAYHKMVLFVECKDNLVIRNHSTFGVSEDFKVVNDNNKKLKISYTDWMSPGFGVNLVVAIDDYHT